MADADEDELHQLGGVDACHAAGQVPMGRVNVGTTNFTDDRNALEALCKSVPMEL